MREIWLSAPRIAGDRVELTWRVDPPTPLYTRTSFYLRFPPGIDPATIPDRLWWTIGMLCLHAHWPLLRPCRVHLPVRLGAGERELWLRLLDAQVITLEAHAGGTNRERSIELVEHGEALDYVPPLAERGQVAAAFSGGKDSLLQAGLLSELMGEVLLVTTTSPMPPLLDHDTPRRRHVLNEIVARRPNVTLLEVESDLRSAWKNDFPPTAGYGVSVNELTDTFLYLSALIAAGWARGATHLFLASEAEVQENAEIAGAVVQHPHAMYSAVTQHAVSALLQQVGMHYGSLISPLRSYQVQQLLWTRYGDLADLQYSCWRVGLDQATCSACSQCLRIAFTALASGERPERMGIDLVKLMSAMRNWEPRGGATVLPGDRVAAELHAQTARSIAATPIRRFAGALAASGRLFTPRGVLAVLRFARLQGRVGRREQQPGYRLAWVTNIDPLIRDGLATIYAASFSPEGSELHAVMHERGERLASWIAEPLECDAMAEASS